MRYAVLLPFLLLASCSAPLEEYYPVTDPTSAEAPRLPQDLRECYAIAKPAEARYKERAANAMGARILTGAVVGAVSGGVLAGGEWVGYGAAQGVSGVMVGSALNGTPEDELAQGGPRRIIDRCLTHRGHVIYSDLGRG